MTGQSFDVPRSLRPPGRRYSRTKGACSLALGEAKDSSIGQIARYIGWYADKEGTVPRAILVASGFAEPVRWAAKAIPGLRLVTYRVQFAFEEATV
jgi:hypothetical protein